MLQTFKKEERICSKRTIKVLFEQGNSFFIHPFKIKWIKNIEEEVPLQVLISVPKKNIRKAVNRNKVKRRIREAYRKQKCGFATWLTENNKKCAVLLMFAGKEAVDYKMTEEKIILVFERLKKEYSSSENKLMESEK